MRLEMTCQPVRGLREYLSVRAPSLRQVCAVASIGGLLSGGAIGGSSSELTAQEAPKDPLRLIDAVRAGDTVEIRILLADGLDPNRRQGDGATALHWAAHRDDPETVTSLIEAGADVDAQDDHGVTPLSLASLNGSLSITALLLDAGATVDLARATGETPLMTAARVGSIDVVRRLVEHGADVGAAETSRGQTALMWAIAEGHTPVARMLVEVGGGVTTRTTGGFTPMLFAAQQGNIEVARLLLEAGANVNEAAPDGIGGNTNARSFAQAETEAPALMVAIDSGHSEMALFLLGHGADPAHSGAGRTPLHSAVQQAMPDVVRALLARGADPNARLERRLPFLSRYINLDNGLAPTTIGATPFWLASSYADIESMRALVKGGADPTLPSGDGTTPLMVAAGTDFVEGQDKYGRRSFGDTTHLQEAALEAVRYCLELGNDINGVNDNGQTALHGAVYFGGTILVPFLIDRGADIDAINHRGQTPWMIAAQGEYRAGSFYTHEETGDVLEGLGADMTLGHDLGKDFAEVLAAGETGGGDPR